MAESKAKVKPEEVEENKEESKSEEVELISVTVKDIPVRHNGEDYEPGDKLEIEEKHFNAEVFEKAE